MMVQIQYNLVSTKMTSIPLNSRRTELGGATIRICVRKSVQVNVDVIIGKSPIERQLHTSMDFRVSDIMLLNFEILNLNN